MRDALSLRPFTALAEEQAEEALERARGCMPGARSPGFAAPGSDPGRCCAGKCPEPAEEALERATGCVPGGLEEAVRRLADLLGGDNGAISAWRILHLYLQRLGCDFSIQAPPPPVCMRGSRVG